MTFLRISLCLAVCWLGLSQTAFAMTAIINARLVTMDPDYQVLEDAVVLFSNERISAIGGRDILAGVQPTKVIDARGGIVMPGMISLHNHTPMVAFRGIGEYNVDNLLFDVMFPLEKELLNRELIHIAARHAAMELALGGVTLVTDMYYHEDEVARATRQVGIRGVLGETVIGFPVVDAAEPFGGLAYAEEFIKEFKDDPLIIPAVAPHAPYTVSPDMLRQCRALSEKYDVPMVMHMAEFGNEKWLIQERFGSMEEGESIIEYLDRVGALHERLLGAHVIELSKSDIALLKERGVGVGHNPKANIKGGQNLARAWEMFNAGLGIGLGTDGPMSSNQLDILNVMGYAARVGRMRYEDTKVFTPRDLVELATISGARALDLQSDLGSIEVGKKADIVILDPDAPNMQPAYDVYAVIAHQAYPGNVRTVIVDGAVVVEDGALLTIDRPAHDAQWQSVMKTVSDFRKTLAVEPQ